MRADSLKDTLRIVGGRTFVYFMLYVVFSLFLLGLLPHLFSIPHIGSGGDIVTMMIPFLLGTSFLALAVSRWFTDSEAPLLMIAFFSVGYIFLSGVSYPLELMPWYWQTAHYLFPAGPAVLAFVKLNSMGGTLALKEFASLKSEHLLPCSFADRAVGGKAVAALEPLHSRCRCRAEPAVGVQPFTQ